jgi:hypothetical protein
MSQIPPETIRIVEKIAELKKAGFPNRIIAKQLGLPLHKVEYLASCFITPERGNKKLSKELCIEIAREYSNGAGVEEIAKKHGVSFDTVRGVIKALGVKRPLDKNRRLSPYRDRVKELFLKGLSDREIAKETGLSIQTVRILRCKMGLRRPRKSRLDALLRLLSERGVVDSLEFLRETGYTIGIELIWRAMELGVRIGYVKVLEASSHKMQIFSRSICGRFIVYLEGYEKKALKRLLSYANPKAKMQSVRLRVAGPLLEHIPKTLNVASHLSMLRDM